MREFSLGRRRFALAAAATATSAFILPGQIIGQTTEKSGKEPPQPQLSAAASVLEQQARTALAKLSPGAQAEVEMKLAGLLRKYGDRLSNEQKADIHKVLAETQDGLEKMRAFPLDNANQPATVFQAYRGEGNQ